MIRSVILWSFEPDFVEVIKKAGISEIISLVNTSPDTLLDNFREGFDFGVLKFPGNSVTDTYRVCDHLETNNIYIDLTGTNRPEESVFETIKDNRFANITIVSSEELYSSYVRKGLVDFPHRFAMIFSAERPLNELMERARKYPNCIPAFVILGTDQRREFDIIEGILSEQTDKVLFWSVASLYGLAATVTQVEKTRHVTALAPVAFRAEPSLGSRVVGSLKTLRTYQLLDEAGGWLKLLVDDREMYALSGQGERQYFKRES